MTRFDAEFTRPHPTRWVIAWRIDDPHFEHASRTMHFIVIDVDILDRIDTIDRKTVDHGAITDNGQQFRLSLVLWGQGGQGCGGGNEGQAQGNGKSAHHRRGG